MREGVRRRLSSLLGSAATRTSEGAGRLVEVAREMRGSPLLSQALAARGRGNPEAAFFLLREAWETEPEGAGVASAFWDVAQSLGRAREASAAAVALVERCVDEDSLELGAQYLAELAAAAPDVLLTPVVVVRLLPALRERIDETREEERAEAEALLRHALGLALDPRNERPGPGLALRLFAEARGVEADTARRAAEIAVESPDLHEAKRAMLREFLEGHRAPRPDEEEGAPRRPLGPRTREACRVSWVPEELDDEALVVRRGAGPAKRIGWDEIEAVAVARIEAAGRESVTVVDLVFNWTRRSREPLRGLRLRDDSFDPARFSSSGEEPLAGFLALILERSHAIPLPDPEAALGLRPAVFGSLADYEQALLGRSPAPGSSAR